MKEIYNTKQSLALLSVLKEQTHPMTAEDISELLKSDGVSKATVYRHLDRLTADGILRRFTPDHQVSALYQYVGDHHDCHLHYHLVCNRCGQFFHMDCEEMNALKLHIQDHHGFLLDSKKTILYGLCSDCQKESES